MAERERVVDALRAGGVVAAEEEADELLAAAESSAALEAMVARRLDGEPTAWITGTVDFLGVEVRVEPDVYVPRWKTEAVARHALAHLPDDGVAVDLCTGSGAIAAFLVAHRPGARVAATDVDAAAVRCAEANGVEAHYGDLFDPLPHSLHHRVDVVVAVTPYVPDGKLALLPRDVLAHEPVHALRGGTDGLDAATRILDACAAWLTPRGAVVLECGADQVDELAARMARAGLVVHEQMEDGDGDPCGVCATAFFER